MSARKPDVVATVKALATIMEERGITELKCTAAGEIVMVRNPLADAIKANAKEPVQRDEFDRIAGMSPDQQDRALQLGGLGPMGSG